MSSKLKEACAGFLTLVASKMAPAQVPKTALPAAAKLRMASNKPSSCKNCSCVVLSPPGRMRPSHPSRSAGVRTSRVSAPRASSISACAAKSPCTAKIPIFTSLTPSICSSRGPASPCPFKRIIQANLSPPTCREHVLLFKLAHVDPAHGLAKIFTCLKHRFRVIKMRRSFHHGLGPCFRITGLEYPRAHKNRLRTKPPDKRRVRGSCNSTCGKIGHRQLPRLGNLTNQIERRAKFFRLVHQLVFAQHG